MKPLAASARAVLDALAPTNAAPSRPSVWQGLLDIDARLSAAGVYPLSPWWRAELERFYASATATLLVEMVGRGGDKSRTSVKMALAETIYGDFDIPKGEVHYYTHISESVEEAKKTIGILRRYLDILGEPYEAQGATLTLVNQPCGFKVLACRVGAVSGWRCIGWTADECAKWNNEGADPSAEIVTSIRGMTVTHAAKARGRMLSSPLGRMGFFYDEWQRGTTEDQQAGHAATWQANPSVTRDATKKLERNESKWRREYAAVPMEGTEESLFSSTLVERATRPGGDVPREAGVTYTAAMDPAFVRNAWTLVVAGRRLVGARIRRSVVLVREWQGTDDTPLDPEVVLREASAILARYGIDAIDSDRYERFGLQKIASRVGLALRVPEYSATEALGQWESIETMLADGELELHADAQFRSDVVSVQRKITPNGFRAHLPLTSDGRHCDYAPSFRLAIVRCLIDPVITKPEPTNAERLAALHEAEKRRWAEVEKKGDESAMAQARSAGKSWVDRMTDEWTGGEYR